MYLARGRDPQASGVHVRGIRDRVELVSRISLEEQKDKRQLSKPIKQRYSENMRQPKSDYLAVPEVSSENRRYIPIDFITKKVIASNLLYTVANATKYTFGILSSSMHMAWVAMSLWTAGAPISGTQVRSFTTTFLGRNTRTEVQKAKVEEAAEAVLDARGRNTRRRRLQTSTTRCRCRPRWPR